MKRPLEHARSILREATRLDPSGLALRFGVRCTTGIAVPLVVALLAGDPLLGVPAAFGALAAGFASRQGRFRLRVVTMLLTGAVMAVSAAVAAAVAQDAALRFTLTIVWGLGCGYLAAAGLSAANVGLQGLVGFIVFGRPPYDTMPAWDALLIFAGGALQTVLFVLVWPFQRFGGERRALEAVYRALADQAAQLTEHGLGAPQAGTLEAAAEALADPQPFGDRAAVLRFTVLLEAAERLRAELTALAIDRHFLAEVGADAEASAVDVFARSVEPALVAIADALHAVRPPDATHTWADPQRALAAIEATPHPLQDSTAADARAILGDLETAWGVASGQRDDVANVREPPSILVAAARAARDALETLAAHLSFRSVYAQHAVRLGAILAVSLALDRVLRLQRGYWIALTAVLILRPEFSPTFTRGVARAVGTIAGAIVASGVAMTRPSPVASLFLSIAFAGLACTFFAVNYGLFSAGIAGYVIFLLAFGGVAEHQAAFDRVGATLLGAALTFATYLAFPTWSRARIAGDLADLLDARRRYATLLLRAHLADVAGDPSGAIAEVRRAVRLVRANAEAAIRAMEAEPVGPRGISLEIADAVTAASERFSLAAIAFDARLGARRIAVPPVLAAHVEVVDRALVRIAEAIRAFPSPLAPPPAAPPPTVTADDPDARILALTFALMDESIETLRRLLVLREIPEPDPARAIAS